MKTKIGFIGYGNMGSALVKGLLNAGYDAKNIYVTRKDLSKFDKDDKFHKSGSIENVIKNSDIIFLAIKPNFYEPILNKFDFTNKTIISIGAGITSQFMKKYSDNYILTIPNTAAQTNNSHTTIVKNDIKDYDKLLTIFKDLGEVYEVDESQLSTYSAVLGSSPAYFYYYISQLSKNIDIDDAPKLFAKIMKDSAQMILDSSIDVETLQNNVCSEGGSTIEFINHMDSEDVDITISEAVDKVITKFEQMKLK